MHPPYSSVFSTEFNPEYGNTDFLFWLRKRSSPKYGNAHGHLNIFYGNFLLRMWRHLLEMCMLLFIMLDARPHAIHLRPVTCIDNVVDNDRVEYHQMASYF